MVVQIIRNIHLVEAFTPPPHPRFYQSEVCDKLGSVWCGVEYIACNTLISTSVTFGVQIYINLKVHVRVLFFQTPMGYKKDKLT
jgi:hypothetical protein